MMCNVSSEEERIETMKRYTSYMAAPWLLKKEDDGL
jgi:hypothetical protein